MAGIGVLLLVGFAWLSSANGKPIMFAALYTALGLALSLVTSGFAPGHLLLGGAITFIYCAVYFGLMHRVSDSLTLTFLVLIAGALLWFGWPLLLMAATK
ncbi:MAG: hypothetical protein P8011_02310 [Acidihalobacter sp.]|jgi:predicted signal transduction protein with EAL and GGDEF domain|uniref:hypothetical protein n=1 Tax=Acidihalobacter sp. TaxID=1872108 RepID=UPI00307EA09B